MLGVFAICVVIMWVIVHSPFGKALQAIRDNETRAAFLGMRISRFRWVAFLISGTFTGLAGILWVPLNGLTTPEVLYWPFSGEIVFTALLGGFRNFTGPIVGGIVFTYLKTYAVATTEYWQLLLGVVLVLLVMLLPTGIVGAISALAKKLRPKEKSCVILLQTVDLQQAVRRDPRLRQRELRRQQGRIPLARGLERRRQDVARQSHQRASQARQRPDPVRGQATSRSRPCTSGSRPGSRAASRSSICSTGCPFSTMSRCRSSRAMARPAKIAALAEHDQDVRNETFDVLGQFGLESMSAVLAGGLAQGERKLLDVAVAYALRPKLLFLDEPTSGVSTRDKTQIMDTVSSVVRAGAVTAVVIEHDMDVVFRYSDRIVMMHEGRFLADGTPEEIKVNKDVANILLGVPLSA